MDGIEDYMFLGYRSHPHFLDGDYVFKGTVLKFVSLGDRYFGYVNDENMLYIVDCNQLEEVAGIDLMRDYSIEGSSINKISGDKNCIYVSADNDMTLLEICLEN
ncbi:MAG: hypothetical protein ACLUVC_09170 [Longibaculum sp.]